MAEILDGAEPFLLQGGAQGILLIHGFTGSPAEMLLLGQFLNECGYTVLAPRLCGHGTSPEEMAGTNWTNWYHSVCDGYHLLRNICRRIHVVGLSMGGLLAMKLAMDYEVEKVVSLSAPIHIADPNLGLLPPKEETAGLFIRKERRRFAGLAPRYSVAYSQTPLLSVHSLLSLIKSVTDGLPRLEKPLLIVQSKKDRTVLPNSGSYIYQHAGSAEKELFWLEDSGHLVTLDMERELVFKKIIEFIGSHDRENKAG